MRYDVKKFLFVGVEEERGRFFQKAQELGVVNFIESPGKPKEIPSDITNVAAAIKVLRGLPTMEQETLAEFALADGLVHKILHYKHLIEKLNEEHRIVRLEMARVSIFGDFSKKDIEFIQNEGDVKIQFFFGKHGIESEIPLPDEVIFIGTDHNLDYFVSVNPEPTNYHKLVEMRIDHPLGELQSRYSSIEGEIHSTEQRLKKYAKYNTFLHHALIAKLNKHHLHAAHFDTRPEIDGSLFVIEGWVPVNKLAALNHLVRELDVHVEEIAIDPTDIVPTYLDNKGIPRVGEDIVHIYDTPSNTDKDPSIWVLIFFSFFFAFIVGDGGYGLIFLGIALYMRYKYGPMKGAKQRFLKLFFILCFACIAWGFLTNSFFGITIAPDNPLRKVSVLSWLVEKKTAYHLEHKDDTYEYWIKKYPDLQNVTDPHEFVNKAVKIEQGEVKYDLYNKFSDNIMMEGALLIGIIHIIISMLRYLRRNWVNLGWIAFIIGCYFYFPYYLKATSIVDFVFDADRDQLAKNGLYLIAVGVGLATIISLFKHKWLGLLEVMTGIQIFSDIMSYLRLYALGLAGSIVTATINETAGAIGFILGGLLIIVGYAINMLLSVMGGVIHGLRLNFLEWYHYSFEGGGKMFKPLRKIPIE